MIEVVTSEDFSEFLKRFEERLNAIEGKLDDLTKSVKDNLAQTKADLRAHRLVLWLDRILVGESKRLKAVHRDFLRGLRLYHKNKRIKTGGKRGSI